MTCVAQGSMVEVTTPHGLELCPIQYIQPGTMITDAHTGVEMCVVQVLSGPSDPKWRMYTYLGVDTYGMQWVWVLGRGWTRMHDCGTLGNSPTDSIFALVVEGGKAVCIGGVVCVAHNPGEL